MLRTVEKTFTRYVSQNVSYTSVMILKKVVKSKIEIGLCVMFLIFGPVLYNLTEALIPALDWNRELAIPARQNVNKFVPCYFMAFPPYVRSGVSPESCPVSQYLSPDSPQRGKCKCVSYAFHYLIVHPSVGGIQVWPKSWL